MAGSNGNNIYDDVIGTVTPSGTVTNPKDVGSTASSIKPDTTTTTEDPTSSDTPWPDWPDWGGDGDLTPDTPDTGGGSSGGGGSATNKLSQTWTLSSTKSITYSNNGTFDLNTLITSGTPVGTKTWTITSGGSYASVSSNTLTINSVGTVVVKLTASGSSSYYSKDASCTITINHASASQSWTLSAKSVTNGVQIDMDDAISGTVRGNKTWSVTNGTGTATINQSGGVLTPSNAGTVTVKLVASGGTSGNYSYSERTQTCTVTINDVVVVVSEPTPEPLKSTSINVSNVIIDLSTPNADKNFIKRIKYDESSKKVLFDIEPILSEGISTDGFGLAYSDSEDNLKNNSSVISSSNVVSCKTNISSKATKFTFEINKSDIKEYDTVYFYVRLSASATTGYKQPDPKVITVTINGVYTHMSKPRITTVDLDVNTSKLKENNITYKKELDIHKFKVSKTDLSELKNITDTTLLPKVIYTVENGNENAALTDIYSSNTNVAILENNIIKFKGNIGTSYIDFKLNEFIPNSNDKYIRYLPSDKGPSLKIAVEDFALKEYLSERSNVFKFSADGELASIAVADCEFLFSLFDNNSDITKISKDDVEIVFDDLKKQTSFKAEFKKISNTVIYI